MSSALARDFLGCLFPFRQNRGGNEEHHPHQAFFSDVANGLATSVYNGVMYLRQFMCFESQNQLPLGSANFESLHSNEDIAEVPDPLLLSNVLKKCSRVEKVPVSIQSLGPVVNSEIGSLNSAEDLRSSRAQAQRPAQSKRLHSCERAESQGKRMCFPTAIYMEEKKQDEKCKEKRRGQNVEDKDDDEEDDDEKKKEKKQDEEQQQQEKEGKEPRSNSLTLQSKHSIEDVFIVKE